MFVQCFSSPCRCHYYDSSENLGCTLGDWHPLSAEKLAALSLHTGGDVEMLRDGYITIPGYKECSKDMDRDPVGIKQGAV